MPTRILYCVFLVLLLILCATSSLALELGIGASVLRGAEPPSTMEQIASLRENTSIKEADFLIRKAEEFEAVCTLTQLEKLRIRYFRPEEHYAGTGAEKNKIKLEADRADKALEQVSNLMNLSKLEILMHNAKGSPDRILVAAATLPKLNDFTIYWSAEAFSLAEDKKTKVLVPAMKNLKTLKIGGYQASYQFATDFPFQNIVSLELDNQPELDQKIFSQLSNLVRLKLGFLKLTSEGASALSSLRKLEEFSGHFAKGLVFDNWKSMKDLNVSQVGSEEIESISKLSNIEKLHIECLSCSDSVLSSLGLLKKLRELGISCSFRSEGVREPVKGIGFRSLANCPDLSVLSVNGIKLNEDYIKILGKLKGLKNLSFYGDNETVTPEMAAPLSDLTSLEAFYFPMKQKEHAAVLGKLVGWKKLKALNLDNEDLTDAQAAVLSNFPNLEELSLQENKLTDAAFDTLSTLKNLRKLELNSNPIEGKNLASIVSLESLKSLNLSGTKITDKALLQAPLKSSSLEILELNNTRIKGTGLSSLTNLPLKTLGLGGTDIDDAGVENLQVPTLEVVGIGATEITEHGVKFIGQLPKIKHVVAYGCGIKYGSKFPNISVASEPGWYDYDYDDKIRREVEHTLNEKFIRLRLGSGKISDIDHNNRADMLKAIGEYEQACSEYDKAIDELIHPKYHVCSLMATGHTHRVFECYDARGMALAGCGKYEKALEDLNKAVQIARASAYARMHRGYVLMKLGKLEEAKKDLDRAIDINPKLAAAFIYRSEVLEKQGNKDLALEDQNRGKLLGYKSEFVEKKTPPMLVR